MLERNYLMQTSVLLRLSGLSLVISGTLYIADTIADFAVPGNTFGIGIFVSLTGLYGVAGLYFRQRHLAGPFDLLAYVLFSTGLAALIGIAFANNFILPKLEPAVLGTVMGGSTLAAFITVGVLFLCGALSFALSVWRHGLSARMPCLLVALGAVPISMPPLFPSYAVEAGGLLISIAMLTWGRELITQPGGQVAPA